MNVELFSSMIIPFLEHGQYLQFALVHKSWRKQLARNHYPRVTQLSTVVLSMRMLLWYLAHFNSKAVYLHIMKKGTIEMLVAARTAGCEWHYRTLQRAAKFGRVELLEWAHMNGCPWDRFVVPNAVASGELSILIWMHTNNISFAKVALVEAVKTSQFHILEWLVEMFPQLCREHLCRFAMRWGRVTVFEWAHARDIHLFLERDTIRVYVYSYPVRVYIQKLGCTICEVP